MATGDRQVPPDPMADRPDSRLRLGLEQTLLAWVRTGLAMMGFGFVLARFGLFLEEFQQAQHKGSTKSVHLSLIFGVLLIVLGVAVNVVSAWMHRPYLVRFRTGETDLPATWKLAMALAGLSAVVGVTMAILLLLMESVTRS
jgi:putative membrane protein